ncbi:phasin family protein [Aliiglaciecola sp. CAU 1673]|uniref:phasin-related domain-containing protein n=1 Tax=Aliiglaciecola sp. CAU 1673 TaxID=3032595 RepID=UPI0023D99E18|nr:phasin family protein [Aliiglaciecola sp. CAU 1673]MDF2177109.1 phasin family protein [Aliiglaciecola sp. CAU 1673]
MSKIDNLKSKVNDAEEFARKIWLAGLGAYGKSVDEVQGRYEKLNAEASKVFEELVAKGSKIEADAKDKFKETTNVEARVAEVRKKLGLDKSDMEQKVDELSAKIDALSAQVSKLADAK